MSAELPILNIAAYRFVELDAAGLPTLRERLLQRAEALDLKGTVLLAPEGLNVFLAGQADAVRGWLQALRDDDPARFGPLHAKESWSATQPFQKLKVRLKREIVRMDLPTLRPATARPPAVAPATLARWIAAGHCDAGRPLKLLDTRNDWEVDAGTFAGAIDWRLRKFTEFPAALAAHRAELAGATVVSFCTGGIRCEKASLAMEDLGLDHAYQLDGGILQYFEDTAGQAPGWVGRCVVFDERGSLDAALQAPQA
ncbi:MAG: hypothetical protein RL223_4492 [Pseudomonadota bacterium]